MSAGEIVIAHVGVCFRSQKNTYFDEVISLNRRLATGYSQCGCDWRKNVADNIRLNAALSKRCLKRMPR